MRDARFFLLMMGLGLLVGVLVLSSSSELGLFDFGPKPLSEGERLQPGDILVTRNEGDDRHENKTPGYWNHCAIVGNCGRIVESQAGQGVITCEFHAFVSRYPYIRVYRPPAAYREAMAIRAAQLVGLDYWGISSIFRHPRDEDRGMNCVSVVRECWRSASGGDPRWHRPDQVAEDSRLRLMMEKP